MRRRWIYLIAALATLLAACAGPAATDSGGSDLSAGGGSTKKSTKAAPSSPQPPLPGDDGPIEVPPLSPNSPRLSALAPLSVAASSADVEVSITGTNISPQATVTIGGQQIRPTAATATSVTVTVSSQHLRSPGSVAIKVQNPAAGAKGGTSNSLALTVTSASSSISISGVSPAEVTAGSDDLPLTVSGSGFTSKSRIRFNGNDLGTSASSGSDLTATVPASLLRLAGQVSVAVFDPTASTMSAPQSFIIDRAPDSDASSVCADMRCVDFGYKAGQCLDDWTCDASGCLEQQACTTPTCQFDCSSYQYGEGQCFGGWICQSGCLQPKDGCPDAHGSSSSPGTDASSCTFACVDPDGAWSYEAGECKDGYQCGSDGCLSSSDCTTAPAGTDPACTPCVDPDGAWSYADSECKDGFCCSLGCLTSDPTPSF